MAIYEVSLTITEVRSYKVVADNEDEAKEIVMSGERDKYRLEDADYYITSIRKEFERAEK